MMGPVPLIRITDPDDDRLGDYTNLTDVALRSKHEPAKGLYIAESSNVITRAVEAGHRPRSFLMAEKWLPSMAPVISAATRSSAPLSAGGSDRRIRPCPTTAHRSGRMHG